MVTIVLIPHQNATVTVIVNYSFIVAKPWLIFARNKLIGPRSAQLIGSCYISSK